MGMLERGEGGCLGRFAWMRGRRGRLDGCCEKAGVGELVVWVVASGAIQLAPTWMDEGVRGCAGAGCGR